MLKVLRSSAGIAIAMAVMNVGTYAFQMVAARLLGPSQYGAVAGMMALLMVLSVVQLGLQATAARRIASAPEDVAAIEQTVLTTTWRAALVLGLLAVAASPAVYWLLRLDGLLPAVLLGLCVVPVTVMGGQAGVLQGERRWLSLSLMYLSVGVPRVLLGGAALAISPTETSAMVGVLAASWLPVLIGSWALRNRTHDAIVTEHDRDVRRDVRRETYASSVALLAFVALSNLDIVVARNVLDGHQAGLYAGGLIVTKAVLFLPQFAVVILFPSMSTAGESRAALMRGLAFLTGLGVACVAGAYLLSGLALVFIGGDDYDEVQDRLWLFATLGGLLSVLQLLVYAGLAKRGRWTKYLVTLGVIALIGVGALAGSVTALAVDRRHHRRRCRRAPRRAASVPRQARHRHSRVARRLRAGLGLVGFAWVGYGGRGGVAVGAGHGPGRAANRGPPTRMCRGLMARLGRRAGAVRGWRVQKQPAGPDLPAPDLAPHRPHHRPPPARLSRVGVDGLPVSYGPTRVGPSPHHRGQPHPPRTGRAVGAVGAAQRVVRGVASGGQVGPCRPIGADPVAGTASRSPATRDILPDA